jgi:hypothetical protein
MTVVTEATIFEFRTLAAEALAEDAQDVEASVGFIVTAEIEEVATQEVDAPTSLSWSPAIIEVTAIAEVPSAVATRIASIAEVEFTEAVAAASVTPSDVIEDDEATEAPASATAILEAATEPLEATLAPALASFTSTAENAAEAIIDALAAASTILASRAESGAAARGLKPSI